MLLTPHDSAERLPTGEYRDYGHFYKLCETLPLSSRDSVVIIAGLFGVI